MKRCEENQLVRVSSEGNLLFPNLDSCIGVVCLLDNGDRWAVHCVQDSGSTEMLEKLKISCSFPHTRKVVSVLLLGNLEMWGAELESQTELVAKHKLIGNTYQVQGKLDPYLRLTSDKIEKTKRFLADYFSCESKSVLLATCSGNVQQGGTEIISDRRNVKKLGW